MSTLDNGGICLTNVTYGISKETYFSYEKKRTAYGIVVYYDFDEENTAVIVDSIRDITSDKESLEELVRLFNKFELSLLHFHDAVEDFLTR